MGRLTLLGGGRAARGGPVVTWNPADVGSSITLSSGNTIASKASATAGWTSVRATLAQSTGKRYFEIKLLTATDYHQFGWAQGAMSLASGIDQSDATSHAGIDARNQSGNFKGGISAGAGQQTSAAAINDVLGFAADLDAGKLWIAKNNVFTTYVTSGNPAAGTAPWGTFTPSLTLFPAMSLYGGGGGNSEGQIAASGTFAYSPPSGFVAWNA